MLEHSRECRTRGFDRGQLFTCLYSFCGAAWLQTRPLASVDAAQSPPPVLGLPSTGAALNPQTFTFIQVFREGIATGVVWDMHLCLCTYVRAHTQTHTPGVRLTTDILFTAHRGRRKIGSCKGKGHVFSPSLFLL